MEDGDRTITINITKIKVYSKESEVSINTRRQRSKLQSTLSLRKPSEGSLKRYSLPGNKPLKVEKLSNELLLLPYRLFSKKQERDRHKLRLAINIYEKYKICSTDLRRRLHVDGPADDVRGMTDIDRNFFECVNGRKITSIPRFKSVMPVLNNVFRIRQVVSYRKDCLLKIEANMRREFLTYENSVQKYKDQASYFDNFIQGDYLRSMGFLSKCDNIKTELTSKEIELQNLANDKFAIISRLIGLDYRYSVQQKYGRFLYYLSPPTWRLQHRDFAKSIEIEQKGFDLGNSSDEDPFVVIFEKLKNESIENRVIPALYFERPQDLVQVFESMEQQQLNYLTHVTYSTPFANTFKKGLTTLKTIMQQNSYSIVNAINEFQALLESAFARCRFLETKFQKIVNGMFYDSVGSLDVLKMTLHLEYCYEKVLGEKPFNLGMVSVAKAVESCYFDCAKRLDRLHNDEIRRAVTHHIELERRKMKKAKLAARELRLFERLEKELLRSCLPSTQNVPVPLPPIKKKSLRNQSKIQHALRAPREATCSALTEGEAEYLALFTEWMPGEDPVAYLQQLQTANTRRQSDEAHNNKTTGLY